MARKICSSPNSTCPAFDLDFCYCHLGFPVKERCSNVIDGIHFRYYSPDGKCTKPASQRQYIDMHLAMSRSGRNHLRTEARETP